MVTINSVKFWLYELVGVLYEVHNELGPGLNEKVYQEGLRMELESHGIQYLKELSFHPKYKGKEMETEYRLDFLINNNIIIELKAVAELSDEHRAQLFNYMRLRKPAAGILVNFASRSCVIERYMYDAITNEILTMEGHPISHKRYN